MRILHPSTPIYFVIDRHRSVVGTLPADRGLNGCIRLEERNTGQEKAPIEDHNFHLNGSECILACCVISERIEFHVASTLNDFNAAVANLIPSAERTLPVSRIIVFLFANVSPYFRTSCTMNLLVAITTRLGSLFIKFQGFVDSSTFSSMLRSMEKESPIRVSFRTDSQRFSRRAIIFSDLSFRVSSSIYGLFHLYAGKI